jgi:hypothetical protein
MPVNFAEFPVREPIAGTNLITDRWRIWLRDLLALINTNTNRLATIVLDAQTAAVPATAFGTGVLGPGQYQVNAFTHITTPGSVTSSLAVNVQFTHKGIVCTQTSAALTSNLNTSTQGTPFVFTIDSATPINYSTTYASNAANSMAYSLTLTLLSINV